MTDTLPVADTPETVAMAQPAPAEPWRRRVWRALLYGKADRHAKARGRVSAGSRHQPEATKAAPSFRILTRKPLIADDEEVSRNPRARSAKLRAAERTEAAPIGGDVGHLLPRLPSLADAMRAR